MDPNTDAQAKELLLISGVDEECCAVYLTTYRKNLYDTFCEMLSDGIVNYARVDPTKAPKKFLVATREWRIKAEAEAQRKREAEKERQRLEKEASAPKIVIEPFGTLSWDDYWWTGTVVVPGLRRCQRLQQPEGSSRANPLGEVNLTISTVDYMLHEPMKEPAAEQLAALAFLSTHADELGGAALKATFREYARIQRKYGAYDGAPTFRTVDAIAQHVWLESIGVMRTIKEGMAYVGLSFRCTWDEEHGFGMLTHKGKVVDIGGPEVSLDEPNVG